MEPVKNNPLMALIQEENAQAVKATSANSEPEVKPMAPVSVPESPPPKPPEHVTTKPVEPVKPKKTSTDRDWERFSFVCSKEIIQKVHDISEKEGFTIRDIMELFLQRGISDYEKKNGIAKPKRKKSVETLL